MRKLKLLFACFLMALLSIGNVWATDVTFDFNDYKGQGTSSSGSAYTMSDKEDVSIGDTKFYGNNGQAHFYANGVTTITPAAGVTITQIVINATAASYNGYQSSGTMTWSTGSSSASEAVVTWTGSATSAFTLSHNKQIRWTSIVVTYTKESGVTPTCSTPTFTPAAGSYEGTQNVTISSTAGATIYYTTDGTTPTTSSSVYSAAIPVAADMTIKAYAVKTDYNDSEVATAAYTITEGPDVTLNLIDGNWGFPTSGGTTLTEYTNSVTSYAVSCYAANEYKVNGSNYFIIGKSGSYILLPQFANPIEKIVVVGNSGGSGAVVFNIFDGDDEASTAVTGCTTDQTFNITNPEANKQYTLKVTSGHNLQLKAIKIYYGTAPAVAKPTISGDENFVTSTTVTLACSTTGADIYYTTDGSDPKSGTQYSDPFSLTATATVRAIAKLGSDWSTEATQKTFTKVTALTTMDEIFAAATTAGSTAADAYVTFNNWVVSGIKGTNAFVTDGTKGFIIYANSHGFNAGDVLSGTVACKVQLYKGAAELTNLTSSTAGLTVTSGGSATLNTKTIDQLGAINTGALVKIENLSYDGTNLSDGTNTIKPFNGLYSEMAFENGKDYNVTGVINYYDALQIMPRSAADIEEVTAAGAPEAPTFTPAAGTYTSAQSVTLACATDGATIYYTTDGTTPTDASTEYTAAIAVNADMTIKAIAYKAGVPSSVSTAAYVINLPLTTMDEIFAKATAVGGTATDVTIVLNNWVVSGIYTNNKDVFVTDGTKGFLIYDNGASMGFNVGDVLSGTVACKVQLFKGAAEITNLNSSTTGLTVTPSGSATLNTKTIDQLGAINTGALVKIVNLTYNSTSKKLSDGTNEITPYKGLYASMAFENGKKYNVTGVVGYYDALQIMPRSAADIEEVVLPDPEISYTPATLTIQQGDAWSAPTFNNPNDVTITSYASNNESVATVTNEGTIALAGGIGTATITATFAGNGSYNAATATYTITVNEAGVYSMSFDLTKVSYDDAADAEVVWNSNVVTITAQQGTGTKVTNYLAGNYSGTTLIEETRLYENNNLVFTPKAGVTITKVEWIATTKAYAESLAKEGTTTAWTNATAALDAEYSTNKKVIITPSASGVFSAVLGKSGSNKGTRGASVVVYYTAESEKAKLTASISIADMNMAVGDADVLLSDIAATSNPNKKAISYAVTSGTAVTIEGEGKDAALHAAAEGTATITATIPDNLGNYTGATTTFTVTVAAALADPELSYDPATLTITLGDTWSAPTFNNPHHVTIGSYASDNEAVATVTSGGEIALAGGIGTAVITAHTDGDATYAAGDATYTITVNAPAPTPTGTTYTKVTSTAEITDGEYLIVYETTSVAFDGSLATLDAEGNSIAVVISTDQIAGTTTIDAATFTIDVTAGTLQSASGKYIGVSSNSNGLKTSDDAATYTNTFSIDGDGNAVILASFEGSTMKLRYNPSTSAGNLRFRYYKNDGQQPIQLYKKDVAAPVADYTRDDAWIAPGELGTVCISHGVASISGANIYQLAGKQGSGNVVFESVATMEPGKPYLFEATANKVDFYFSAAVEAVEPDNSGAMKGTFSDINITSDLANTYYFEGHTLYSAVDLASLEVKANRAYVKWDEVPTIGSASPAPGRRYIILNVQGANGTTDIENQKSEITNQKFIKDGQLFILRGEKLYDATGRLVK